MVWDIQLLIHADLRETTRRKHEINASSRQWQSQTCLSFQLIPTDSLTEQKLDRVSKEFQHRN